MIVRTEQPETRISQQVKRLNAFNSWPGQTYWRAGWDNRNHLAADMAYLMTWGKGMTLGEAVMEVLTNRSYQRWYSKADVAYVVAVAKGKVKPWCDVVAEIKRMVGEKSKECER